MKKNNMKMMVIFITIILSVFFAESVFSENNQFDEYGGWKGIKGKKTGVFHTENIKGRWWIITPEGNIFWSTGMYSVRMSGIPETGTGKRPYKENCIKKYGNEREWARITRLRLKDWGFNTIGDWSSDSIYRERGFAYVAGLDLPRDSYNVIAKGSYGYFPDVFSDEFRNSVHKKMSNKFKNQSYLLDDPKLLGYFLADEPSWYGSKGRRGSLVDDFIRLSPEKAGKKKWVEFIQKKYKNIASLNNMWGLKLRSFNDLLNKTEIDNNDTILKDKLQFLKIIAMQFTKTLVDSLREFDTYHMILGTRPTRLYPEVLEGVGKYVDIFGMSFYGLNRGYKISKDFDKTIDDVYKYAKKPIMLGFLITAKDTPLPYGVMKNQKDRGISYWRYLRKVASRPEIVGLHWFQYFDPPKRCYDKQAANWGIVNDKAEPYQDAVYSIKQANKMVYAYALGLSDFAPEFESSILHKSNVKKGDISKKNMKEISIPIADSGFEQGKRYWKFQAWKGNSKARIDSMVKHSGNKSVKIQGGSKSGWDSVGVGIQYNPKIVLKPEYEYKLSAWIRTEKVDDFAMVKIKASYNDGTSDVFSTEGAYGNNDWRYVEKTFSPRDENSVGYLAVQLVGKGTAWFDDIKLEVESNGNNADEFVKQDKKKIDYNKTKKLFLSNSGFEQDSKDWSFQKWKGRPKFKIDKDNAHLGKKSAKISGNSIGWDSTGVLVHSKLGIVFDPKKKYVLGGWIKTLDAGNGAFIRLKVKYSDGSTDYFQTESLSGSGDWSEVKKEFQLKKDGQIDYFVAQMVGKGTAWFDDIFIEEIIE